LSVAAVVASVFMVREEIPGAVQTLSIKSEQMLMQAKESAATLSTKGEEMLAKARDSAASSAEAVKTRILENYPGAASAFPVTDKALKAKQQEQEQEQRSRSRSRSIWMI
jgi:hypothetical protein